MKKRAIRAMCVGVPNVGKSTLLNHLVKKNVAATGNRPGVTTGQQWLRSSAELELLDTPGVLWHKFATEKEGLMLALSHDFAVGGHLQVKLDAIAGFASRCECRKRVLRSDRTRDRKSVV